MTFVGLGIRIGDFPGTDQERDDLLSAVERHHASYGMIAHEKDVKYLLFERRIRKTLEDSEFNLEAHTPTLVETPHSSNAERLG